MAVIREDLRTEEELMRGMDIMNGFGTRLTGSPAHGEFIDWLKRQCADMGFETVSKKYEFDYWHPKKISLTVGGEQIHVSSAFPYSGETPPEGVTGELKEISNNIFGYAAARNKIGVVHIKNLSKISSKIAFDKRRSIPESLEIEPSYRGPVSTSFVKTLLFSTVRLGGVKALVCVWEDMSAAMVEGQYLNFILHYLKVPVVWVNETEGKKLLAHAAKKDKATLTLEAEKKRAGTESFYVAVKGTESGKDTIIINTHTDGNNCVEENGAIGMLAMLDYVKKHPVKHDVTFVFCTGHLRLSDFRTGTDQATSRWLADTREMWDGKGKHKKAYAGVSVEHLGCSEWKDVNGVYTQTNPACVDLVYTGNKKMDDIYYRAAAGRENLRTITLRGHNFLHFGEGQPLFNKRIPEIALVPAPDYLCAEVENHCMDKFNVRLMRQQIETLLNCVYLIDVETPESLGKPQFYSIGVGKLK